MRELREIIIYKDKLEKLQVNLLNLTGASLFIIETKGRTVLGPSNTPNSCKIIDDTVEDASRYREDLSRLIEKIKQQEMHWLAFCQDGCLGFAIPLILRQELLGVIVGCMASSGKPACHLEWKASLLIKQLVESEKCLLPADSEKIIRFISEIFSLFINGELELNELTRQLVADNAELSLLYDISHIFASSFNAADASRCILERLCDIIEVERASLMLYDKQTNELKISFSKGIPEEIAKNVRLKLGEGIAGWVAIEGRPLLVRNVEDCPVELRDIIINHGQFKTKSFLTIPLISSPLRVENRIIGVINLTDKKSGSEFIQHDLDLLSAISTQIALLIEHKRFFDDLKELLISTVRVLISVLEAKDLYTSGHSQRVTECALAIAEELGLSKVEKSNLELAGLLHDIGKIEIPKEILSKPAKLTGEEYDQIKTHSIKGIEILKHIKQLSETIPTILYHHERYDGSGYPKGLKGDKIPLLSRILALADVFDAMTSARPYRPAMPREQTAEEIRKGSGKDFDPLVCEAFFKAYLKGNI